MNAVTKNKSKRKISKRALTIFSELEVTEYKHIFTLLVYFAVFT